MDIRLNLMKSKIKYEIEYIKIYSSKHPQQPLKKNKKKMILIGRNEIDVSHLMANPLNVLPIDL